MSIEFTQEELQEVENHFKKYPEKKAAIMPVLWMAQKKWGWLSKEVMEYVAKLLDLPISHVEGVASFYTMYFKKPMGKYHIQVCTNVSCMLRNGDKLFEFAKEYLQVKNNERTTDGVFSLEEVECMGACGGAPMIAVNEDFYENMDKEQFKNLLDELKNKS